MNQRNLLASVLGSAALAMALFAPRNSHASETFPEQIQLRLGMPCPPPCTICHKTQEGGSGTTDKDFAAAMVLPVAGMPPVLTQEAPETVVPALEAVSLAATDSDGDLVGDVAELQAMRDPNIPSTDGVADALVCPPTYGCGARIAPRPPVDGSAFVCALIVAGYLALRSRKSA